MRRILLAVGVAAALLAGGAPSYAAEASSPVLPAAVRPVADRPVTVTGQVGVPASYTPAELSALDPVTVPAARGGSVTGVALEDLVNRSAPSLDAGKNPLLRVTVAVTGRFGQRVTFAVGELDAGFGNHPALLVSARNGSAVDVVVPGDRTPFRSVGQVRDVHVTVSAVATVVPAAPGSVQIITGRRTVTLSAATLRRLPQRTATVGFLAGAAAQQHTETGPNVTDVLLAAGILPLPNVTVTAVGGDGYAADVTLGEAYFGGRQLLLSRAEDNTSLAQPRLVPAGDVKGGRYVSGVVALIVTFGY